MRSCRARSVPRDSLIVAIHKPDLSTGVFLEGLLPSDGDVAESEWLYRDPRFPPYAILPSAFARTDWASSPSPWPMALARQQQRENHCPQKDRRDPRGVTTNAGV